jgi:hypothetical protein
MSWFRRPGKRSNALSLFRRVNMFGFDFECDADQPNLHSHESNKSTLSYSVVHSELMGC